MRKFFDEKQNSIISSVNKLGSMEEILILSISTLLSIC